MQIEINSKQNNFHINEILDQCIDWSDFWRLLVILKGFCCILLTKVLYNKTIFIFSPGPNLLSISSAEITDSIFDDIDF